MLEERKRQGLPFERNRKLFSYYNRLASEVKKIMPYIAEEGL
jgi:hypothetical protein